MTTRKNNRISQFAACATPETPTLASILSQATAAGDEVIYFGPVPEYEEIIQNAGAVPMHIGSNSAVLDIAALASALTPRTRAIVLGRSDGLAANAASRAVLATLTRLLTTARNVFGQPVYLIADESMNISCGDQPDAMKLSDFYPFTRVSRVASMAA